MIHALINRVRYDLPAGTSMLEALSAAGIRLPAAVLWTAGGLAVLCLVLALARSRRAAQAPRPERRSTNPGSSEPR
jgi:hypothetical protein